MPYNLGLHIEDNYIKYAKVLVEKGQDPKVEAHGLFFYDNLNMAIDQIISETYSYGIDISTNLNNEFYSYFEVFSGMKASNLSKHLSLRFAEEVCAEKNINPNTIESRFLKNATQFNEDESQVIYVSANKSDITSRNQQFKGKLKRILPVSIANTNLMDLNDKTNIAILNIDSSSTLTIILKGQIKKVININIGMSNILSKLNQRYNSYHKSYNQCKKIVIFDEKAKELLADENEEDVDDITPLLYDVTQRVSAMLSEYVGIVNNLYITGTCVAINNIDLYFQEAFRDINVELLIPKYIKANSEAAKNVKDLIEVNSAVALAITEDTINGELINFRNKEIVKDVLGKIRDNSAVEKITKAFSKRQTPVKVKTPKVVNASTKARREVWEGSLGGVIKMAMVVLALILIAYILVTMLINNKYDAELEKIGNATNETNTRITEITSDIEYVNANTAKYEILRNRIQALLAEVNQLNGLTHDIPGLLTNIALVLPDEVKISKLSITGENVTIEAECATYAPLGFFISSLKNEEVMKSVVTEIVNSNNTENNASAYMQYVKISGVVL